MPGQTQSRPDGEAPAGAQIIAFVPRARADRDPPAPQPPASEARVHAPRPHIAANAKTRGETQSLAAFEHIDAAPDNFRHRMIANGAGFAAALLLALTGIWLAEKMAELRHDQDCVLMRLQSCAAAAPKPLP